MHCVIFMLFMCSVIWLFWLGCQYQCKWLTGKTRLQNDLLCVDGDVKPYSLTECHYTAYFVLWSFIWLVRWSSVFIDVFHVFLRFTQEFNVSMDTMYTLIVWRWFNSACVDDIIMISVTCHGLQRVLILDLGHSWRTGKLFWPVEKVGFWLPISLLGDAHICYQDVKSNVV